MGIEIFTDKCIGCGICVENCPGRALSIINDNSRRYAIVANKDYCIGCKRCTRLCPNNAIKVTKTHKGKNGRMVAKSRLWLVFVSLLIGHLVMAVLFFFNQ